VGLLKDSTLMGAFPIPPPDIPPPFFSSINMISTSIHETPESYDPWIVPSSGDYLSYDDKMCLSLVESAYQAIQSTTPSLPSLGDTSPDPFHVIFPTNEMIMVVMSMEDTPWDNGNHPSILFLERETIESYQWISTPSTVVVISSVPESTHDLLYEGNLINTHIVDCLATTCMCVYLCWCEVAHVVEICGFIYDTIKCSDRLSWS
jgi:hypothetical protein